MSGRRSGNSRAPGRSGPMDGRRTAVRHDGRVPLDPTPRTPAPLPPPRAPGAADGHGRGPARRHRPAVRGPRRRGGRRWRCSTSSRSWCTAIWCSVSSSASAPGTAPPTRSTLLGRLKAAGRRRRGRHGHAGAASSRRRCRRMPRRPCGPPAPRDRPRPAGPSGRRGRCRPRDRGIGGNIDAIRRLSDYPVTSFELTVSGAEATAAAHRAGHGRGRRPAPTSPSSRWAWPGAASG